MRIIGIDPGTGITGFGVIEPINHKYKLIDAGVIRTPAKQADEIRLQTIYENICEIIDELKPTVMSIEKLFFAKNVTTAMTVSQARGVILLAAQQRGLTIFEYTPLQIKQAITGYGKADKAQMQEMVRIHMNLKEIPKPDDCADAIAAAICHSMNG
jgi:crossover junction endodeoxyribonuclease RuvC